MKILYLGLRPKEGTFHYPVIRTERCDPIHIPQHLWPQFTHIIFTSQTAVEYWPGPWDKKTIAIGESTAKMLRKKGLTPLVAQEETQEGVIELIREIKGHFFIPRSKLARPVLTQYLQEQKIPFFAFDLYDTHFQKLEPVPNLDEFDEIVFTSPSTVEGFLRIFKALPKNKKLTPIGSVTRKFLNDSL